MNKIEISLSQKLPLRSHGKWARFVKIDPIFTSIVLFSLPSYLSSQIHNSQNSGESINYVMSRQGRKRTLVFGVNCLT